MSYPKLTPIIAKGATEPRYLEDRFSDVINVKDFGAKGDGVTDDYEAVQAALDEAHEADGIGVVYMPAGTYLCSEHLNIRSNTTVFGYGATLLRGFSTDSGGFGSQVWVIYSNDETVCSNVSVFGVTFDGNYSIPQNSVIVMISSNDSGKKYYNIHFEDCVFKHWVNNHALDVTATKRLRVINCKFMGYKYNEETSILPEQVYDQREAIQVDSGGYVYINTEPETVRVSNEDFLIEGCYFGPSDNEAAIEAGFGAPDVGVGGHSANNYETVYSKHIVVRGCYFDGCTYAGVRAYGINNFKCENNKFIGCKRGVVLHCRLSCENHVLYRASCDNSEILNNEIFFGETQSTEYGIYDSVGTYDDGFTDDDNFTGMVVGSKNVTISGNVVYGYARGVHSRGSFNTLITNNVIKNCNICISGVGDCVKISNNYVCDSGMLYFDASYWAYAKNRTATPYAGKNIDVSGNTFHNVKHQFKVVDIQEHNNVVIQGNFLTEFFDSGENPSAYHYLDTSNGSVSAIINNTFTANGKRTVAAIGAVTSGASSGNIWIVNGSVQS